MEFTVNKSDLVRELSLSQGVVEKKTTIPSLSNVLIEAKGDRIELTATDLELGIRSSCGGKVSKEGSVCVPAKKLLDYVRLLDEGEVAIKTLENHWIQITYKRSRTKLVGMSRESFPVLPQLPSKHVEVPAGAFNGMIARTIFAISSEESRYTLNGALLVVKPEGLAMVATDGHRLALVEKTVANSLPSEVRALIPRKAMGEIQKLLGEMDQAGSVQFAKSESHLFFRFGERLLVSQQLTGQFPNYEAVIPKDNTRTVVIERGEITAAVQRVAQFADDRTRAIRMSLKAPNQVKLSASSSELGESEETIEAPYTGDAIDVGFNAQYLLDFLRAPGASQVQFDLKDEQSAGLVHPVDDEGESYRYVVMPMRI
jgi:DNA polymerase-3 subunit beta